MKDYEILEKAAEHLTVWKVEAIAYNETIVDISDELAAMFRTEANTLQRGVPNDFLSLRLLGIAEKINGEEAEL